MYSFTEERPWGGFENLLEADTHKVKRLVILPGQRISYQRYEKRAEHWFVISGRGIVTLNDTEHHIEAGMSVDVAQQEKHRIHNTGDVDLIVIEVQTGTYFGEDDIERFVDDYNRV